MRAILRLAVAEQRDAVRVLEKQAVGRDMVEE